MGLISLPLDVTLIVALRVTSITQMSERSFLSQIAVAARWPSGDSENAG
jgi:hypothetical protein